MNSLNQIILEGNVCRQPELRQSAAGTNVGIMPIAVNRSYKNMRGEAVEEVSYFDITTFGKTAEVCTKYATIGRHVRIVGRLKQDRWKNLEGKAQSKVNIIAEHVELLNLPRRQGAGALPNDGAAAGGPAAGGRDCAQDSRKHAGDGPARRRGDTEATLVATNAAAARQEQLDYEEDTEGEDVPAF